MNNTGRRQFLAMAAALLAERAKGAGCMACADSPKEERRRMASVSDYRSFPFTHGGRTRTVYEKGSGPGVLILHELPGLTPCDLELGRRLEKRGFHVFLPLLFGKAGADYNLLRATLKACPGSSFNCHSIDGPQGVLDWLRPLCPEIHGRTKDQGTGIGVIGMCLTGSLPLALLSEDAVVAPVLSQPSLPFGSALDKRRALGISQADLTHAIHARADVPILGLRFEKDWISPRDRFDTLEKLFPTRFRGICLPAHKPHAGSKHSNHAVLSASYCDDPGSSTREAFEETVRFLTARLTPR